MGAIKHDHVKRRNTHMLKNAVLITNVLTIGARCKATRIDLQLTQQELADAAGVAQTTIGNLEAGRSKRPQNLAEIAQALQVRFEWLKTGKGPKHEPSAPGLGVNETAANYELTTIEWPFKHVTLARLVALSEKDISYLDGILAAEVRHLESGVKTKRLRG